MGEVQREYEGKKKAQKEQAYAVHGLPLVYVQV